MLEANVHRGGMALSGALKRGLDEGTCVRIAEPMSRIARVELLEDCSRIALVPVGDVGRREDLEGDISGLGVQCALEQRLGLFDGLVVAGVEDKLPNVGDLHGGGLRRRSRAHREEKGGKRDASLHERGP